ncbi:CU044_2847 family protein [Shewanella halotolerans]|uniref:CU044_2847 family protein n=1 Tax=Shewanella halotolerans TaxID=2864204 RepID=UPI001C659BE9|nr:CU044_2847 family protein [Shewanella halotolerans]QYJ91558.1 hypothetical protein K0H81_08310 [Shewanella halotolerans]
MNKIVKLNDGLEVEIETYDNQDRYISLDNRIDTSIENINEFLSKIIKPVSNTYKELNKSVKISETKVTLGVKLGGEGGFVLAKTTAEAHIQVEMVMRGLDE